MITSFYDIYSSVLIHNSPIFIICSSMVIHDLYRLSNKAASQNVADKWHVAYYGTHSPAVRKILDSGDLLRAGKL